MSPQTAPCKARQLKTPFTLIVMVWAVLGLLRPAAAARRDLLGDVYINETAGGLEFGNATLRLRFDEPTGRWTGLFAEGVTGNLISPSEAPTMDVRINGTSIAQDRGTTLQRWQTEIDADEQAVHLRLVRDVSPRPGQAFALTCTYTLRPNQGCLDRSATLSRSPDAGGVTDGGLHFEGFVFTVPGALVGRAQECVVDVPGPFWPKTYLRPETPYRTLLEIQRGFHSAPDAGFGILAVTNKALDVTLASWMDTAGDVNYGSSLQGDGKRITLRHADERAYRLKPGMTVRSDAHRIEIVRGGLPAALACYRQMCERRMPLDTQTPDWVRQMILLEVYPPYYPGGFKELTQKLPFYKKIGFNTLYLMPHWVGGYSPIDLYAVDPRFGTEDDLKAMTAAAHALGMRVLFDMVIHGFNEKSAVPGTHPELFVRNEDGSLARHRTWKSITTDWAAPAYQKYMVDLVVHDLKTYNIDGYRVDAASYKGPNWDPNLPYPAYRSGTAAPELMKAMLDAMRQIKSEAVLLSEVFGPTFYNVCNLAHDNQTESPQFFLEQMEAGKVTAQDYKRHMANVFAALPDGANRVFYARNHDTSWFYHFNGYTPRFMALDAIHALCAIPEVFGGDPRNQPHPDEGRTYETYRKLFAAREAFPEVGTGETLFREVEADNPRVFTALRRGDTGVALVVVSLSDKQERAELTVAGTVDRQNRKNSIDFEDPINEKITRGQKIESAEPRIRLVVEPFQVLIGRL